MWKAELKPVGDWDLPPAWEGEGEEPSDILRDLAIVFVQNSLENCCAPDYTVLEESTDTYASYLVKDGDDNDVVAYLTMTKSD